MPFQFTTISIWGAKLAGLKWEQRPCFMYHYLYAVFPRRKSCLNNTNWISISSVENGLWTEIMALIIWRNRLIVNKKIRGFTTRIWKSVLWTIKELNKLWMRIVRSNFCFSRTSLGASMLLSVGALWKRLINIPRRTGVRDSQIFFVINWIVILNDDVKWEYTRVRRVSWAFKSETQAEWRAKHRLTIHKESVKYI